VKIGTGKILDWWFFVGGGKINQVQNNTSNFFNRIGAFEGENLVTQLELKPCVGKTSIGEIVYLLPIY